MKSVHKKFDHFGQVGTDTKSYQRFFLKILGWQEIKIAILEKDLVLCSTLAKPIRV
jgi:hypothetical protein